MKATIASSAIALSIIVSDRALADPFLILNEPREIGNAKYSCRWAQDKIKSDQHLIKTFKCAESELCQRAIDIDAVCKVTGPVADVRSFHSKLLANFASTAKCTIAIMRVSDEDTDSSHAKNLETYDLGGWELNLAFTPGWFKQHWALWRRKSGKIVPTGVLEGKGDPGEIARDVCTIMTRSEAKILD